MVTRPRSPGRLAFAALPSIAGRGQGRGRPGAHPYPEGPSSEATVSGVRSAPVWSALAAQPSAALPDDLPSAPVDTRRAFGCGLIIYEEP